MATEAITLEQLAAWAGVKAEAMARLDLTQPLKRCAVMAQAHTKRNFRDQRSPDGIAWKPLAQPRNRKRDKRKSRRKGSDQILRDTGVLMASVAGKGEGHVESIYGNVLTYGTNIDYGPPHQYGTATIPKREFVGWSLPMQEEVQDIFGDWALGVLTR